MIEGLQQKTEQEKIVLATAAAISVTVILFGIWGYNFAHSGKLNNLASSATGVASVVEQANLRENFDSALEQLQSLDFGDITNTQEQQQESVGTKHMNVFANPDTPTDSTTNTKQYGENSGDVLY